jgi:hypothetical protein
MVTKKTAAPAPAAKKVAAKKAPVANKAADVGRKAGASIVAAKKGAALPTSKAEPKKLGPPPDGLKTPKSLGAAADEMKKWEDEQGRLNKEAAKAEAKRKWLKAWLIENLQKREDASGVAGKLCRVNIVEKEVPRAENWTLIYRSIVNDYLGNIKRATGQEDGAFALLQRRLGDTHVKELWDAHKPVPGVGKFTYKDLSVTQL